MMDAPGALASRDLPAGRAWVRGNWAQIATPPDPAVGSILADPPRLARSIALSGLPIDPETWRFTIGIEATNLRAAQADLSRSNLLIAGSPGSGRSTALATLAAAAERGGIVTIRSGDGARECPPVTPSRRWPSTLATGPGILGWHCSTTSRNGSTMPSSRSC